MRHDVYIDNDSGAYSILSSSVLPRVIEDQRGNDRQFVDAHEVILQGLVGDASFVARVVAGEPLTEQERQEWISQVRWPLRIPCAKLVISGGFDPDTLADFSENETEYVKAIDVPAGNYLVEVFTHLHTMNGRVLRERWGPDALLGAWFRRDHPGKPFPSWVASELVRSPEEDPGHEDEWRDLVASVKSGSLRVGTAPLNWVGIVVHLLPLDPNAKLSKPGPDGWFPEDAGLRHLAQCPLGIATEVYDHETRWQLSDILPRERKGKR
jgi:hypothetical protein